jgi:hypothetical protein
MECVDGDCKQLERQFRQCANKPRELLSKNAEGADEWIEYNSPEFSSDHFDENFHHIQHQIQRNIHETFSAMNHWINVFDRSINAQNYGNSNSSPPLSSPSSVIDASASSVLDTPGRQIIRTTTTTVTHNIPDSSSSPPVAKHFQEKYASVIEQSHKAMRSAIDSLFGALGSKQFTAKSENQKNKKTHDTGDFDDEN